MSQSLLPCHVVMFFSLTDESEDFSVGVGTQRHHTMEFFEICSKLIASLAQ